MKTEHRLLYRSLRTTLFALICFVAIVCASPAKAQTTDDFRRGEVLVEIKPGASIDAINQIFGTSTIQRIYGTNIYRLRTPKGKKEQKWRKRIANHGDVLSATLNPIVNTPVNAFGRAVIGFPGDHPSPGQSRPAYLEQDLVGDLAAIQLRSLGTGVIVAVIDTGIDRNHLDLRDHLWTNPHEIPDDNIDNDNDGLVDDVHGWNFLDGNKDTMELRPQAQTSVAGHGTFIAGLIALIAPGAKIMPVRVFSPDGLSDAFSVAQGIKYAVDHGARVINLSFGSTEDSVVMHDAVTYARQRGVLVVAAVGNENQSNDVAPQFPANWNLEVMAVAAIDANNHKASFSNYGSNVSISAPGVNLVSLYPDLNSAPDYARWSGTSFAAPLASAGAALILEANPSRDARGTLESTATGILSNNPGLAGKLGAGRLDALRAVQSLDPVTGNQQEIVLLPTGIEAAARGEAEVSVRSSQQEFEVEAEQLQPRSAYKIVVDGNVVIDGSNTADPNRLLATASNFGALEIKFSTNPSGNDIVLPAALNPVTSIKLVEVRDTQNRVVLANSFGASQPGGSVVKKEAELTSTAGARGKAQAEIEGQREKLRVEGEDLQSGIVLEIFADGVSLGTVLTQSGYFRVEFTSDNSSGRLLPAALRPVTGIGRIEVRGASGQIVLQGTFQAGGDDFGGGGGGDGGGGEVQKEADLIPTGVDPDAKGEVKTKTTSSRETLEIKADKLDSNAVYTVIVDGISLPVVFTDNNGSFDLGLSTDDGTLPPQLRPISNIQRVQVIDSHGRTVLTGGPPI